MAEYREAQSVYSLCSFDSGVFVPTVELIDADSDEEAVALASSRRRASRPELWHHHRLVADIPAARWIG